MVLQLSIEGAGREVSCSSRWAACTGLYWKSQDPLDQYSTCTGSTTAESAQRVPLFALDGRLRDCENLSEKRLSTGLCPSLRSSSRGWGQIASFMAEKRQPCGMYKWLNDAASRSKHAS